jgi:hypothetical protein
MATSSSGNPNDGRGADLATFTGIWTHVQYPCQPRHDLGIALKLSSALISHDQKNVSIGLFIIGQCTSLYCASLHQPMHLVN